MIRVNDTEASKTYTTPTAPKATVIGKIYFIMSVRQEKTIRTNSDRNTLRRQLESYRRTRKPYVAQLGYARSARVGPILLVPPHGPPPSPRLQHEPGDTPNRTAPLSPSSTTPCFTSALRMDGITNGCQLYPHYHLNRLICKIKNNDGLYNNTMLHTGWSVPIIQ